MEGLRGPMHVQLQVCHTRSDSEPGIYPVPITLRDIPPLRLLAVSQRSCAAAEALQSLRD